MKKLSVAEYAELKGISVQAVYKKLGKLETIEEEQNGRKITFIIVNDQQDEDIKPYSTELNLNSTELNRNSTDSEADPNDNTKPYSTDLNRDTKPYSTADNAEIDTLKRYIGTLEDQLKEKDKQIENLQRANDEKDQQIKDQFSKFTDLLYRSQELEAVTHKHLIEAQTGEPGEPGEKQPKKTKWYNKLFHRKTEK